jgi:hypothetical protein
MREANAFKRQGKQRLPIIPFLLSVFVMRLFNDDSLVRMKLLQLF